MPNPLAIDALAHILTEETMKLLERRCRRSRPSSRPIGNDMFELSIAGVPYRPFPKGGFDIEQRLRDMAASEVDMQVLFITPQTFFYNQDAGLTTTSSIIQNDQIGEVRQRITPKIASTASPRCRVQNAEGGSPTTLERAISESWHEGCADRLSNIMGKNLDEPGFEPVWQVANQHACLLRG